MTTRDITVKLRMNASGCITAARATELASVVRSATTVEEINRLLAASPEEFERLAQARDLGAGLDEQ